MKQYHALMRWGEALQKALEALDAGVLLEVGVAEEEGGVEFNVLSLTIANTISQNILQNINDTLVVRILQISL